MSSSASSEIDFKSGNDVWGLLSLHDLGSMFPGAKERNLYRYFPIVVEALREARILTAPMLAMALGTIAAETAGFGPARTSSRCPCRCHACGLPRPPPTCTC